MVAGLLLIALIFFVFAQAAFTRSGGQSAADAAALAAAQEARDQLYGDFLNAAEDGEDVEDLLDGRGFQTEAACDAATDLADQNDGAATSCQPDEDRGGYRVEVQTQDAVGSSVIPGTEDATAQASAMAVIESLCTVDTADEDRVELECEEADWEFEPDGDDDVPEARDVFRVYLED